MKIRRIAGGVAVAVLLFVGSVWVLSMTLGNMHPVPVHGQTLAQWAAQINASDPTVSNQANAVLNQEIIPQLQNQMVSDTNDSNIRMTLVNLVNDLPGVSYVYYQPAESRRISAVRDLGSFGPAASAAVPALIQAVQGNDAAVHESAIVSLGDIHTEPDKVIPFLVKYLDDDNLNDEAATALGKFGPLAKPAVPKIIPLLHASDDDAQAAAKEALKKIDPEALANAMSATTATATNAANGTPKN